MSHTATHFDTIPGATLPATHRHRLHAVDIGQTFIIDVALPPVPVPADQLLPAIYVTDASGCFGLAAQTARLLQMGPFPLPPALVVGVGYPADTPEDWAQSAHLRVRDMSPWVDEEVERRYRNAPPRWALPPHIRQGGAGAFLDFIENGVKPFIAAHYAVDPDDTTLVGDSMGGLFTLYALFARPQSFRRYIAISPAIYWDNRHLLKEEAALAATTRDLPVHLFLGVGALEEAMDVNCRFVSNLYELDARLRQRAYPSLDMHFHVFPDETHMSVFPGALARGLTAVFGGHRNIHDWSKVLDA